MKPVSEDLFYQYAFLSFLEVTKDGKYLTFVETKCDVAHNDYRQRMHVYDTTIKKEVLCTAFAKRYTYYLLDDAYALVVQNSDAPGIHTDFVYVNLKTGEEKQAFSLPCIVNALRDYNEQYYVVSATISRSCPNYYKLDASERQAYEKTLEDNRDYVIFDEYPFFFNGEGIMNGNRNTLFLVDKTTYAMQAIVKDTIDVESFDVEDGRIIYSGMDFTTCKGKWSHVWQYDGETKKIYDGVMQINRVFFDKGRNMVFGTFAKEYGAMEAGKFYELKDGEMHLYCDNEYSLYNSVGSDCRYGRTKNFYKFLGVPYFVTSSQDRSILVKLENGKLETVLDSFGSIDDFVVTKNGIYVVAMQEQQLQEVYAVSDGVKPITALNTAVLKDCYVALPEELVVDKKIPITGWVLKPMDYDPAKKYPAILDIHGGPKTNYGTVFFHEMQYWAGKGYFVFFCNPRGSDGRGNAFADLRHNFGKIDYEDIMDFTDAVLERYPAIDRARIGVTGGSYGGYMTNWIIGHTDRFACAASQRSISNWITEVTASDYGIDFPIEQEFDDLYHCEKELWDMSPLKYANEVKTPTLFLQSTEDYRCPVPEALQMYTTLVCRGVETRMILFKHENHELSRSGKPLHRRRRLAEITGWMDSHLRKEG